MMPKIGAESVIPSVVIFGRTATASQTLPGRDLRQAATLPPFELIKR